MIFSHRTRFKMNGTEQEGISMCVYRIFTISNKLYAYSISTSLPPVPISPPYLFLPLISHSPLLYSLSSTILRFQLQSPLKHVSSIHFPPLTRST